MYAIIKSGGKQYRVKQGDILDIELVEHNGQELTLSTVLMVQDGSQIKVGKPFVENAHVKAQVLGEAKGPKEITFKYKKRKHSRRKVGHRQKYSRIQIKEIVS